MALVAVAVPAHGASALDALLAEVASQAKLPTPVRSEGTIESNALEGKKSDRVVLVERARPDGKPGRQTYLEIVGAKTKALVLSPTEAHVFAGGKATAAEAGTKVGFTSAAVEDLLPFDPARCHLPQVIDSQADAVSVRCEPKTGSVSAYVLAVWKFDRERGIPLQVLLYEERLNNLVKMIRFDDPVLVGDRWRPTRVLVKNFPLRTQDVLTLTWKQDPKFRPELFDPKALAEASAGGGS